MRDGVQGEGIGQRVIGAAVDRDQIGFLHGLLRLDAFLLHHGERRGNVLLGGHIQTQGRGQEIGCELVAFRLGIREPVDVHSAVSAVRHVVIILAADRFAHEIGITALDTRAVENVGLGNRVAFQAVAGGNAVAENGVGVIVLHVRGKHTRKTDEHDNCEDQTYAFAKVFHGFLLNCFTPYNR